MNGTNDLDDGWAELARELGLEGDHAPPPPPARPAADLHPRDEDPTPPTDDDEFVEVPGHAPTDADLYGEAEADGDTESEDSTEDGDEADGEGETTGEPGEPKKKRRRRRRRKRKPGEAGAAPTADGELSEESDESAEADEPEAPTAEDASEDEEGATPAATRELIANWDVPSWETIVTTMLFRPQGR
jgi:hypothetical protein